VLGLACVVPSCRQQASSGLTSIRAAIEAASPLLALDPEFDIDNYAGEIAAVFDRSTRIEGGQ
jgi:hypothetical protein